MERSKAYEFIEESKYILFPNKKYTEEQIEDVLVASSDGIENYIAPGFFKDPKHAFMLTLVLGFWGIGMLYIGKTKRGLSRLGITLAPVLLVVPLLMLSAIYPNGELPDFLAIPVLGIFAIYVIVFAVVLLMDIIQAADLCRQINCEKIIALAAKHYQASHYDGDTYYQDDSQSTSDIEDDINELVASLDGMMELKE